MDRRWDPDLVLAPGERADAAEAQARLWARKEAVLKACGVGWPADGPWCSPTGG